MKKRNYYSNMYYKNALCAVSRLCAGIFVGGILLFASQCVDAQVVVNGSVFGGGNLADVTGSTTVTLESGNPTVETSVYGGGALADVSANSTVHILAGNVQQNVYGGGLGRKADGGVTAVEALVGGDATVNIGSSSQNTPIFDEDGLTYYNNVVIGGYVFGANDMNGTPQGQVTVNVYHTKHTSANMVPSAVTTPEELWALRPTTGWDATGAADDYQFALKGVYGGGNLAHYVPTHGDETARVRIYGCENTIDFVYGGGKAADGVNTDVVIDGGFVDTAFAGGDGAAAGTRADLSGDVSVTIHGGYVGAAFGGSNTTGDIGGTMTVDIDNNGGCGDLIMGSLFGGGNLAATASASLSVACPTGSVTAPMIGEIYGGGNKADVNGPVTLTIEGGLYTNVFGGNNQSGTIDGDVTLILKGGTMANAFGGNNAGGAIKGNILVSVVDAESEHCPLRITNVYGGGQDAAYAPTDSDAESPVVNIRHLRNYDGSANSIRGDVFGGGLGLTATVTANPVVNIGATTGDSVAIVDNNVYGGGSLASVEGSTTVNVRKSNTVIKNTVYGAGKGVYTNPNAAIVEQNATVTVYDGNIWRSIYGGGELSSVGTFSYYASKDTISSSLSYDGHVKGEPESATAGTGITSVYIKGGVIGKPLNRMPNPADPTIEDDYGYIFCAGKGMADSTLRDAEGVPYANRLAVVDSTYLEISGGLISASVYGGSENGEVLRHTHVKITGGQIGEGFDPKTTTWDGVYDEADWTTVIAKVKDGTFTDADAAGFHFCDAWPFNAEGTRYTYDHYATYYDSDDKQYYYDEDHTQPSYNGANKAGDGHSFFGHVFGGGSGYYPFKAGVWRRSAGRVLGNTKVEITGGHILTNIYGGNEITDVIGSTKVVMTGGTLGVPRSHDSIQARPVNCNLFGAGMGDPRIIFNQWSNVASTEVIVGGDAVIFGSVFGGGEDGHVLGDANTTIKGKAVIGTNGGSGLDGNVYGGGRGYSTWALTAGVVSGNVNLTIQDTAKIHGSIYGGGRLAAVGTYLVPATDGNYGLMRHGTDYGNITIDIIGGTIGNSHQMGGADHSIGDVFGGSKGILGLDVARDQKLGLAKNTTITIKETDSTTTHILGNVYGGGEIASVGHYDYADATEVSTFLAAHPGESMVVGDVYDTIVPDPAETIGLATITISGGTIGTAASIGTASQVAAFTHREAGNTLYKKGFVFGGCLGMAGTDYSGYSFVTNSKVTISGTAMVMASVFGGGENGHVFNCTDVRIEGGQVGQEMEEREHYEDDNGVGKVEDIFFGNVYGGGRGIDTYRDHGVEYHSVTAGRVRDSANVTMTGGRVTHNIYGGGSLASVGYKDEQNSGTATVSITGGIVGYADGHTTFDDNGTYYYGSTAYGDLTDNDQKNTVKNFYKYAGNNEGNVYGSGRGHAGVNVTDQYVTMAFTKNTFVTIGDNAQVRGSVFGGGENGHVRKDTKVTIAGTAQIGVPLMSAVDWGDAQWRVSPDGYVSWDTLSNGTLSEAYYHAEGIGDGIHLHEHWIGDNGEGPTIYRGNVYGGGRGVTPTDNTGAIDQHEYSATAGRVYGNATVEVTGGHIYHDLFGGGSLASVGTLVYSITTEGGVTKYKDPMGNEITGQFTFRQSTTSADSGWHDTATTVYTRPYYLGDAVTGTGLATVIVRGGVIGTRGINEGSVFGSGRGIAGAISSSVAHLANANNTYVSIRPGADIRGAVFGGGANGHVKEDTYVEMTGGTVGVKLPLAVRKIDERTGHGYRNYNGNVYGGGRGVSVVASTAGGSTQHLSETAGRVFGNTRVKISGGKVYHSVFGGGSLASVGDYSYKMWNDGDTHRYRHLFVQGTGQAVVHITGDAIIGNAAEALERPLNEYNDNDALTVQYVLRTEIDNAEWHGLSAAAAETKWNGLSDAQKQQLFTELNYHYLGSNSGMVFGSGRGVGALHNNTIDDDYVNSAFTRNTIVVVDNDGDKIPVICGSVFGGGENGHVKINTHVDINGGIIGGIPLHDTAFYPGRAANNGIDGNDTYKFSNDANLKLSLEYEDNEDNAGHGPAVYRGNVYGGGRGVDHTDALRPEIGYSATAGRVYGDSEVEITGGVIYHHVFGGGSLASVGTYLFYEDGTPYRVDSLYEYKLVAYAAGHTLSAKRDPGKYAVRRDGFRTDGSEPDTMYVLAHATPGTAHVDVSGGQVGVTGINEGSVFGGGRGIAGQSSDMVTLMAYCYTTDVTIRDNAKVRGSVFGGGANGHVLTDSKVTMTGGTVGVVLSDEECAINELGEANIKVYHGNVYGGGRGVDPISSDAGHNLSYTAGRVYGDAEVNISGGKVLHNVYGGGSLATVGTILYRKSASDPAPGTSLAPTVYDATGTHVDNTGLTVVTISDSAEIGTNGMNNGSVFGSCRGVAGPGYNDRAYVYNTTVNINAGTDGKPFIHGSVFGSGENGHVQNTTTVNINGGTIGTALPGNYASLSDENKKKYNYIGNVYGAGRGVDTYDDNGTPAYSMSAGYVRGSTTVNINGGTIYRSVYGGGSMGLVGDYGVTGENDFITVSGTDGDGNPVVNSGMTTVNIKSSVGTAANVAQGYGGNVYGSSRGVANDPTYPNSTDPFDFADMAYVYKTQVNVGTVDGTPGAFTVYGNVYGGGEAGHVDWGGTEVNILSGTVAGSVFGGGQGSTTSPTAGIVDGPTQVNIGSASQYGQTAIGTTINGYVFGANDAGSSPLGKMQVDVYHTAHNSTNAFPDELKKTALDLLTDSELQALKESYMSDAVAGVAEKYALKGVYGGGNEASVLTGTKSVDGGGEASNVLNDKYIEQRLKGTGLPASYGAAWPGGISRESVVNIHQCEENTVMYVYGGGRAANTRNATVGIEGGRFYRVFAGGDGSTTDGSGNYRPANISDSDYIPNTLTGNGDATVTVDGGVVFQLFGGSNTSGKVFGKASVGFEPDAECPIVNSDVFGGGNKAEGEGEIVVTIPCGVTLGSVYGCANNANYKGNVTLNVLGGNFDTIYGGSKGTVEESANIDGNVTVNVYGGNITNIFGGSNVNGNITGIITVNIDIDPEADCPTDTNIINVYGGGNLAAYRPAFSSYVSPRINIIRAMVQGTVFGGGYGESAVVHANPLVVVGADRVRAKGATTDLAVPEPNNQVFIGKQKYAKRSDRAKHLDGDVFGGGNAAEVQGNTEVVIKGSKTLVYNNVYGGGNAARVSGNTNITIGHDPAVLPPLIGYPANGKCVMTAPVAGSTIRYTLDGSKPGDESSVYSDTLTLAAGQVPQAIAISSDGDTSRVSVNMVATPVATMDSETGEVTIKCATAGATIKYVIGTGTPATVYDPEDKPTLAEGQTIKIVAVLDHYSDSRTIKLDR